MLSRAPLDNQEFRAVYASGTPVTALYDSQINASYLPYCTHTSPGNKTVELFNVVTNITVVRADDIPAGQYVFWPALPATLAPEHTGTYQCRVVGEPGPAADIYRLFVIGE